MRFHRSAAARQGLDAATGRPAPQGKALTPRQTVPRGQKIRTRKCALRPTAYVTRHAAHCQTMPERTPQFTLEHALSVYCGAADMSDTIDTYLSYLRDVRRMSPNTV